MKSRKDEPSQEVGKNETTDLTERVLMTLVFDVSMLAENVEQIKVKVLALAREHGISTKV